MSLVVAPRSPALARLVSSLGYATGDELPSRRERILPSGDISLMVNLHEDEFRIYDGQGRVRRVRGAMLAGPRAGPTVIDTAEQRRTVAVSFTPGGAAAFFAMPLSEACDQLVELGDVWGRDGEVVRERLCEASSPEAMLRRLEAILLDRLVGPTAPDPAIAFAAAAFERSRSIAQVASRLGLLPRPFVRRFRAQLGLAPKRFSRVRRLQRVLVDVHPGGAIDWADVAVKHGYFDQAHLINDFRELTGITPAAYAASVGPERNHVPLAG
jgi:AraC-like DNA-binding protein